MAREGLLKKGVYTMSEIKTLMAQGTIVCEGDSNFLVNDPKAREVYLGPQFTM